MRPTKVRSIGLALMLLCAMLAGCATDPPHEVGGDGPRAFVPSPRIDFGTLREGESYRNAFIVENHGGAPLAIEAVHSACASMVADFDPIIAPGGAGRIQVALDSWRGRPRFNRPIVVRTNDPQRPQIELRLTGRIVPTAAFDPPSAVVLSGWTGQPIKNLLRITSLHDRFQIETVTGGHTDRIAYDLRPRPNKDGQGREYWLIVAPLKNEKGSFFEVIQLRHNDLGLSPIPVRVNVAIY